jgi:DNA-binding Lrp family transcriptional regulator
MECDETDAKILRALMNDGRASMRQIAERTSLTTPTVSSRLARLIKSGTIRKFMPVLSPDSSHGIEALVTLQVDSTSTEEVAKKLSELREIESVYMTTGQGITLKIGLEAAQDLQPFLAENIPKAGVRVTSSQIVTGTVKEEPSSLVPKALAMNLKCDYCEGPVTARRPYTLASGRSHYYFCCKTCRKEYMGAHPGTRRPKA